MYCLEANPGSKGEKGGFSVFFLRREGRVGRLERVREGISS